jgi:hypothetical protein
VVINRIHLIVDTFVLQDALKQITQMPQAIHQLVFQLDAKLNFPGNFSKRKQLLEILVAVCEVPEAYT